MIKALVTEAPAIVAAEPEVEVLSDVETATKRTLRLHLHSPRRAWMTHIGVKTSSTTLHATVDEKPIVPAGENEVADQDLTLSYFALPQQGAILTLEVQPGHEVTLAVTEIAHGLPAIPGKSFAPRSADLMAANVDITDSTIVQKSFQY
jgi:hypothetical protein